MNKELIDKAWACLPKEFKEEVKYKYNKTKTKKIKKECDLGFLNAHEGMFGAHNLTSDAEGEEMLMVSRKQIDVLQGEIFKTIMDAHDDDDWQAAAHYILDVMPRSFADLFGSKCLPDELNEDNFATKKPQPAEPKFKVGDKVRVCSKDAERYGKIGEVIQVYPSGVVDIDFGDGYVGGHFYGAWAIEPYTEPTETFADKCKSQDFDTIVKDGFRGHNRLHIAAMMVPSVIATVPCSENEKGYAKMVATRARILADALISECKKGSKQ